MESAFLYPDHRTMAEVLVDEQAGCRCEFVLTKADSMLCDNCRMRLERPGDYPEYAERWAEIAPKGGLL